MFLQFHDPHTFSMHVEIKSDLFLETLVEFTKSHSAHATISANNFHPSLH